MKSRKKRGTNKRESCGATKQASKEIIEEIEEKERAAKLEARERQEERAHWERDKEQKRVGNIEKKQQRTRPVENSISGEKKK